MKKGILRKTLGQILGENKMKPYAAALLPSQVEMLLKHSLDKNCDERETFIKIIKIKMKEKHFQLFLEMSPDS